MPFANAKVVARPAAATAKKTATEVTETIEGLADVCALEACLKAIEGTSRSKRTRLRRLRPSG